MNQKGADKCQRRTQVYDDPDLCWRVTAGQSCEFRAQYTPFRT